MMLSSSSSSRSSSSSSSLTTMVAWIFFVAISTTSFSHGELANKATRLRHETTEQKGVAAAAAEVAESVLEKNQEKSVQAARRRSHRHGRKPPPHQIFVQTLGIALGGTPHNMCMRVSDRSCLHSVLKQILNEEIIQHGVGHDVAVDRLEIVETMCGSNMVMFPESDALLFSGGGEERRLEFRRRRFRRHRRHDNKDEDKSLSSRTAASSKKLQRIVVASNREYYNPAMFDLDRILRKNYHLKKAIRQNKDKLQWRGGAQVSGHCRYHCQQVTAGGGASSSFLSTTHEPSSQRQILLQDKLCHQLHHQCGGYFRRIKDCEILFPKTSTLIQDVNNNNNNNDGEDDDDEYQDDNEYDEHENEGEGTEI